MIILTNSTYLFFVFSSYLLSWYFFSSVKYKESLFLPNMYHFIVYYTFQLSTSTQNCTIQRNLWHRIQKGKPKNTLKHTKNKYQCPSTLLASLHSQSVGVAHWRQLFVFYFLILFDVFLWSHHGCWYFSLVVMVLFIFIILYRSYQPSCPSTCCNRQQHTRDLSVKAAHEPEEQNELGLLWWQDSSQWSDTQFLKYVKMK
jgi:hypothetical protein